jgi:hypothetical protein
MAKLIIEPKKSKEGIEFVVTYHDVKSDNQFMITTTANIDEAMERLRATLIAEAEAMAQKKKLPD